ncbi:helix-turn-helix domain-containing protein [Bacillus sp. B-jedd]|uniref:helix-turn-helix domain-containing protein n=1 Tax=Bacillus sp. B-jedd TaxID=1476857 RepID=UPI0005155B65|nr:helix-turn-helix transcriptional regulator [Bacillus sp. B-jedd]CEG25304.1 Helix-turn-helix domain protein [Bacillus sp. B-jedd]
MISIGERIKTIRIENFYTQAEFAKLLGISQGTLSDIEKGKCYPSFHTLKSLRSAVNADINKLLDDQS